MTSVNINCIYKGEKEGMNFEIRFGQEGESCNEEKAACIYLLPFVKEAMEKAIRQAENKDQPKIETSLDGGPSIVTLD